MALDFDHGQTEAAGDWEEQPIEELSSTLLGGAVQGQHSRLHGSVLVGMGSWWYWNRLCWLSLLPEDFLQGSHLRKELVAGEP